MKTGHLIKVRRNQDGSVEAFENWYQPTDPNDENGCRTELLDPRFDLESHSPDGFECGYEGSGPAQLALAILAVAVGDEAALKHHQAFKRYVIATLGKPDGEPFTWSISVSTLDNLISRVERSSWERAMKAFFPNSQKKRT